MPARQTKPPAWALPWAILSRCSRADRESRPVLDIHAIKRRALDCHQSQKPDAIWEVHEAMHKRRGEECGVKRAEAYLLGGTKKGRLTLPVTFLSKKK